MTKPPRRSLQGLVRPPQSHNQAVAQLRDDAVVQLRDDDVPDALPEPEPAQAPPEEELRPARRARRTKANAEPELKDYAHRSLYARPETFELVRKLAFEKRVSAQDLYREGLFLMLRKHGQFRDKRLDDV